MIKHLLILFLISSSVGYGQSFKSKKDSYSYRIIETQHLYVKSKYSKPSVIQSPVGLNAPGSIANNVSKAKWEATENRGIDSCGVDTLQYLANKNTVLEWYYLADTVFNATGNLHDHYSRYAQYYDAPQTVDVHGAAFYGYVFTAGDSALVTVTLYSAAADSFPDQIITQKDIWVYDDFSNTNLDVMRQRVSFDSVITMNQAYLIGIASSTTEELVVLSNSFTNLDGNGEELGFTYYSNPNYPTFEGWYDQFYFAANWDFDWIIEPAVSYSHNLSMSLDTNEICEGDSICVTFDTDPIVKNRMYNSDAANWWANVTIDWGNGIVSAPTDSVSCHWYNTITSTSTSINAELTVGSWDGLSCTSPASSNIVINPLPMANFNYVDNLGGSITFTDISTNADSVFWDLGTGVTTTDSIFAYVYNPADTTYEVTLIAYNTCGSDTVSMFVAPTPVSVNEFDLNAAVSLYPNPTNGILNVTVMPGLNYTLEVIDVLGKTIGFEKYTGNTTINLSQNTKGIYFVRINAKNATITKRIILSE